MASRCPVRAETALVIEIDGSLYSGSGTIVRQAVALAALTSQSVHLVNARLRRRRPGLRRQHMRAVQAIGELVNGVLEGCSVGSSELTFHPGRYSEAATHQWDIGSAGSTTMLASAVLPILAFAPVAKEAQAQGGLFQDRAPSYFHLRHVLLPMLERMGIDAAIEMIRPGYVPTGGGILKLVTRPSLGPLRPLILEDRGDVERIWGIALSSHLHEQAVSQRMTAALRKLLLENGYDAQLETVEDATALQRGAGLAAFVDLTGGSRIGADRAGAPGRSSEAIGAFVARQLLQDLVSGATLDRFAADQVILYAALADGESRFRIPVVTDHVLASAWLSREFLAAEVRIEGMLVTVNGVGFKPGAPAARRPAAVTESVTSADESEPQATVIVTARDILAQRQTRRALRRVSPDARVRGAGFTGVFVVEASGDAIELAARLTRECADSIGHATAVLAEELSEPVRLRDAVVRVGLAQVAADESFCFRLRKRGSHLLAAPTPQLEVEIGSTLWLALKERHGRRPKVDLEDPDVLVLAEILGPTAYVGIIRKAWRTTEPGPAEGEAI